MEKKIYSGGAGIRTRIFFGDQILPEKRNIYEWPLVTSGNVSSVQLAQIAQIKRKSSRLLMWRTMGPKLYWIGNCSFTKLC